MKHLPVRTFAAVFAALMLCFPAMAQESQDLLNCLPEKPFIVVTYNSGDLFTCPTTALLMLSCQPALEKEGFTASDMKSRGALAVYPREKDGGEICGLATFNTLAARKIFTLLLSRAAGEESATTGKFGSCQYVTVNRTAGHHIEYKTECVLLNDKTLQVHYGPVENTKFGTLFNEKRDEKSPAFAKSKIDMSSCTLFLALQMENCKDKQFIADFQKDAGPLLSPFGVTSSDLNFMNDFDSIFLGVSLLDDGGLVIEGQCFLNAGVAPERAEKYFSALKNSGRLLLDNPQFQGKNYVKVTSTQTVNSCYVREEVTAEGVGTMLGVLLNPPSAQPHAPATPGK